MQAAQVQTPRKPWKLLIVLAVCAAPMLLSYFFYYVVKPEGRTNYGSLLEPRNYPLPKLQSFDINTNTQRELGDLKGKWVLMMSAGGNCDKACQSNLYYLRQIRTAVGKEMQRVERVWFITDQAMPISAVLQQFEGTHMWRTDAARLSSWLPVEAGAKFDEHIYVLDPLGNLMMRFPKDADPAKVKKDLSKLLKASAIG